MKTKEDYFERHKRKQRRRRIWVRTEIGILILLPLLLAVWGVLHILPDEDSKEAANRNISVAEETENGTEADAGAEAEEQEQAGTVPRPDIDRQLLTINDYSRPGKKVEEIQKIVIHYIGNPKTSAQQNRDYFESLKDLQNVSMSANFIIGLQGEIIECVPLGEIAYASKSMNRYSISIENCHPDATGKFTEATYESCVHLTAYLVEKYGLEREDIIRHYDVTGKECPRYFVRNQEEWEKFRDDVMAYISVYEEKSQ
ncbi:MAG: peptidoglycan recognition family protein [Eubacteriales bacterium]|nr:peptidoglycan recognition family protein [Eubacteriales bacterium]